MAKEIGGPKEPGDAGTTVGQIMTPMCPANVGRKNTPGVHDYSKTFNENSPGGKTMKTGSAIEGPGVKGEWKRRK